MKKILITDVTLRDAHQSLIATRMITDDMIPIAKELDTAGFFSMEVWGGATFDSAMRFLNEDPWERLKTLRRYLPNTKLQMLLRGQNLLGYRHYADDIVETFVFKAAENGIDIFRLFDALNDLRNLEKSIESIKKVGKHAQGAISYTISPVHTIQVYVDIAKKFMDMGVDSLCIKDMAGLLLPESAFNLVKAIKAEINLPLAIHSHATAGISVATLLKAVEAGADILDTAISAFSMQTSHSPTEAIVAMLNETKYKTGLDLEHLANINRYFKKVRENYKEFETGTIVDTEIFLSQVPGGMLSNLESQLKQQNAFDKYDDVLKEIPIVRKDFGYPPLVTPTSQIVGTQAVMNVLAGEKYKTLTTESKNLLVGNYGKCPAKVNEALQKRALKEMEMDAPVLERPADRLASELDSMIQKTKEAQKKKKVSMEDVLTYALFPNIAPNFFDQRDHPQPRNAKSDKIKIDEAIRGYVVSVDGHEFKVIVKPVDAEKIASQSLVPSLGAFVQAAQVQQPQQISNANQKTDDIKQEVKKDIPQGNQVNSPVTGTVLAIIKNDGDTVAEGDVILKLEAMKVEFDIKATFSGKVKLIVKKGDVVQAEQTLCYVS